MTQDETGYRVVKTIPRRDYVHGNQAYDLGGALPSAKNERKRIATEGVAVLDPLLEYHRCRDLEG